MFCCQRCSHLSTILNNIVEPESGVTISFNIVDNCEQCGQQNIVQSCFHQLLQQPDRIYPCRLFYLYNNCVSTFLTVFILTHPVNFPCGRKPEHPEKTIDILYTLLDSASLLVKLKPRIFQRLPPFE